MRFKSTFLFVWDPISTMGGYGGISLRSACPAKMLLEALLACSGPETAVQGSEG